MTAVTAEKLRDSALTLEPRHVDIEVHPVDALQLKGQMVIQYLGDALWYAHFRLRYDSDPSGSIAASAAKFIGRNCLSSSPSTGAISRIIRYAAGITRYISSV